MSTVILLNIEGRIINVAHIVDVDLSGDGKTLYITTSIHDAETAIVLHVSPAVQAAYNWLLSLAVNPVLVMGETEQA